MGFAGLGLDAAVRALGILFVKGSQSMKRSEAKKDSESVKWSEAKNCSADTRNSECPSLMRRPPMPFLHLPVFPKVRVVAELW